MENYINVIDIVTKYLINSMNYQDYLYPIMNNFDETCRLSAQIAEGIFGIDDIPVNFYHGDISTAAMYRPLNRDIMVNRSAFEYVYKSVHKTEQSFNEYIIKTMIHEITHAWQHFHGRLNIGFNGVEHVFKWEDTEYSLMKYNNLVKSINTIEEYNNIPWEKEANEMSEKYLQEVKNKMNIFVVLK